MKLWRLVNPKSAGWAGKLKTQRRADTEVLRRPSG